jgi:hypothetical protein
METGEGRIDAAEARIQQMEGRPMKHGSSRVAKLVVFAVVVALGIAMLAVLAGTRTPAAARGSDQGNIRAEAHSDAPAQARLVPAVNRDQKAASELPAAICRLRPECQSDLDCDFVCGVGLGKCLHSTCPRRICACK